MLDFRKLFLALALVTLTVSVAAAGVQMDAPAFACVANAGVPPIVRYEGVAELVGDLVLNCTGGYPAQFVHGPPAPGDIPGRPGTLGPPQVPQVNVQVFLNTNVTSRLEPSTTTSDLAGSEALLMIDEPASNAQRMCPVSIVCTVNSPKPMSPALVYKDGAYNVWQGRRANVSAESSIAWMGVPIDAPGTQFTRVIRITNIRANANGTGTSSTLVPSQITAYISVTGVTTVPINNPQQTVAWVQQGLEFSVRKLNGDSGSRTLSQCSSNAGDLFTDPNRVNYSCYTGRLRYNEMFGTAFKVRFDPRYDPNALGFGYYQNTPGATYNASESGFSFPDPGSNWAGLSGWVGVATQGTRLRAQFNNVPAGVRMYVSIFNDAVAGMGVARLVNTDTSGGGAKSDTAPVGSTKKSADGKDCDDWKTMAGTEYAEIPIFNNVAVAVWEVIDTNPLAVQRMEFGYLVAYKANTANNLPGLGSVTVNGTFAPLLLPTATSDQAKKWGQMSSVLPVPRFVDNPPNPLKVFVLEQCVTNLLFPFVTNQAGFDTGMVISNTSADPWGHSTESGTCKLSYYGDTNGGAAPPAQTSAAVPAGDYLIWGLSSGGKFGIAPTQGFQGYIIAQCKFRWAHGFAFISDYGNTKTAQGYLALVMDANKNRDDVSSSENLGQ